MSKHKLNLSENNTFKSYFILSAKIVDLKENIQKNIPKKGKPTCSNKKFNTIATLFTKASKTFNAIRYLCNKGYIEDAAIFSRSLCENLFIIKWLLLNEENTNLYLESENYDKIELYKNNTPEVKEIIDKENPNIKEQVKKLEGKGCKNIPKFKDMTKQIGLENIFKNQYKLLSWIVHNKSYSLKKYMQKSTINQLILDDQPNSNNLKEVLIDSNYFFLAILEDL